MNRKARAAIETYAMLRQGDRVIAAVSGGADSVALLDVLCGLSDLELTVEACHLNHCLRGAESDRDEAFVRELCTRMGVPLEVRRVEVARLAREAGLSVETAAREARYAFFEELARARGAKVATAHTRSDSAETVLLNLARGTGLEGLCGIPPVRDGWIIRPLIGCTRAEVEAYCARRDLRYVTDSSNLTDDYARNRVRHQVLPVLEQLSGDLLGAVARMTEQLSRDADFLRACTQAAQERACVPMGVGRASGPPLSQPASPAFQGELSASLLSTPEKMPEPSTVPPSAFLAGKLLEEHPAVRSRVIARLLEAGGVERSSARIARVETLLETGGVTQVSQEVYAVARDGILRLERKKPAPTTPPTRLELRRERLDGSQLALDCGKAVSFLVLNCAEYEIFENNVRLHLKNAVDYDKINVDIFLRTRNAGDRMKQAGRGCTKSLKKLMNELRLEDRERRVVLADSGGVVYVEGLGADDRAKVDHQTKKALVIKITEQKTEGEGHDKRYPQGSD